MTVEVLRFTGNCPVMSHASWPHPPTWSGAGRTNLPFTGNVPGAELPPSDTE